MSRRSNLPGLTYNREHIELLVQAGIDFLDALDALEEDLEPEHEFDVEDENRSHDLLHPSHYIGSDEPGDDGADDVGDGSGA